MTGMNSLLTAEKLLAATGSNKRPGWLRKAKNDVRFAHATGRLRSLAAAYMSEETLLRFSDNATSIQQLHEFLDQANYPAAATLEARVELGARMNLLMLKATAVRTLLPAAFALESNFHNLKWLIKNLLLHKEAGHAENESLSADGIPKHIADNLMTSGDWQTDKLWADCLQLLNNNAGCRVIPKQVAAGLLQALQDYYRHRDIGAVTRRLDQLYFISLYNMALSEQATSEKDLLLDYVALLADSANLQTCLRAWQVNLQQNTLLSALVPGGEVAVTDLVQAYKKIVGTTPGDNGNLDLDLFHKTFYPLYHNTMTESLLVAVKEWNTPKGRTLFTRKADELLLRLALKGRCNTYGCEAVAGLFLERQIEIKNLRIMLALRTIGKSFEERLEMLRKGDYYGTR